MSKVKFAGVFLCFLVLSACHPSPNAICLEPPSIDKKGVFRVPVMEVIDGDTVKVRLKGRVETVRLLLIDTPETHHPRLGVQPYGPEASRETHRLLDHKKVILEIAENQGRDKYGRLLAYLFTGGTSVEVDLLEKGLARVAYVIPPNTKYLDTFRMAEGLAKKARIGVWKVPGYADKEGYHPEVIGSRTKEGESTGNIATDSSGACGGRIKGNISKRGKIYHVKNDPFYSKTKAERCFNTEQEAQEAGFRPAK